MDTKGFHEKLTVDLQLRPGEGLSDRGTQQPLHRPRAQPLSGGPDAEVGPRWLLQCSAVEANGGWRAAAV